MWSTAVWLQSNRWKHPLKSGVKAGLGVEHYYLHTHTHTMQPGHLTVESRADTLLLCPSKQQTHTFSTFSLIYLCLQRPHQQGGKERNKERRGWKTGTPKCQHSVLLEPLKALSSPSRMKLPALIWLYLLCYFNNKENNLCFMYIHSVAKITSLALPVSFTGICHEKCFDISNWLLVIYGSCYAHVDIFIVHIELIIKIAFLNVLLLTNEL